MTLQRKEQINSVDKHRSEYEILKSEARAWSWSWSDPMEFAILCNIDIGYSDNVVVYEGDKSH